MEKNDRKVRIAQTEKRLLKLSTKLEARLHRMDSAIVEAQAISKELEQIRKETK